MKLKRLIELLTGFHEEIDDPDSAEVKMAIDTDPAGEYDVLSIYEGKAGEIWIDIEEGVAT